MHTLPNSLQVFPNAHRLFLKHCWPAARSVWSWLCASSESFLNRTSRGRRVYTTGTTGVRCWERDDLREIMFDRAILCLMNVALFFIPFRVLGDWVPPPFLRFLQFNSYIVNISLFITFRFTERYADVEDKCNTVLIYVSDLKKISLRTQQRLSNESLLLFRSIQVGLIRIQVVRNLVFVV